MIKEKIYEMLGIDEDLPMPEDIFNQFSNSILYGLQRQVFAKRKDDGGLRLSQIGKCLRQQYFMAKKYPAEKLQPRAKMTFLFGDIVEAIVVALIKSSGINLHSEQKEVCLDEIKGHIDGIITINNKDYLFECKSMSDGNFKKLEAVGLSDDFGYLSQTNSYMHCLNIDKCLLIAVNKNTGHIAEVEINKSEEIVSRIKNDINILKKSLKNNKLPPRKYEPVLEKSKGGHTGRMILPIPCSYCAYKNFCWENLQQDFNNNKPIWIVKED